jgi:2-polyprenyl-6-methoxyphenol hydroxylase-like FAD-dependent oxidoreductase
VSDSYDVIVVGARCAGAPLATMLARSGFSVCLVDKDGFPSDTPSTHGIQPTGVKVLERLGVLPRLLEVAPPMVGGRFVFDDDSADLDDVVALTGAPLLSVRRTVLDEILVNFAVEAGVEVRTGSAVTGLLADRGRVTGVESREGKLRARLVVGADGTHSAIAKLVGAREYFPAPSGRLFMWAYYAADPTAGRAWIGKIGDYAYLVTPCDGGLTLVGACPSIGRRDEARAAREAVFQEGLRAWPELHAGIEGAEREGPIHTMANMQGFFRESAGPGWALVGDAGHFKDPTPGQGIADALRQAEKLTSAIAEALPAGPERQDRVLRDFWRWRDDDAWEMYWFAFDLGAPGPTPPVLRHIQRRIAADPKLLEDTMRIFNHELRPSQVFKTWFSLTSAAGAFFRSRGQRREVLRELRTVMGDQIRRERARRRLPSSNER